MPTKGEALRARGGASPQASRPSSPPEPTGAETPRRPRFSDRWRRCATVALLTLAGLAAPLSTAQAQTELWSATLTVSSTSTAATMSTPAMTWVGWDSEDSTFNHGGSITGTNSFTHDMVDHRVDVIRNNTTSGELRLRVMIGRTSSSPFLTPDSRARITFHVGSGATAVAFNLGMATALPSVSDTHDFTWTPSGLTWAEGDSVPVRLTLAEPTATATVWTLFFDGGKDTIEETQSASSTLLRLSPTPRLTSQQTVHGAVRGDRDQD